MALPGEGSQQQPIIAVPVPLWRNRSYLLLASGQAISEVGTQVSDLAYILLILALTHSPAQVGLVGALELIPVLLLSLHAGALLDRWDRKRVMIFCDAGRALCLASIVAALVLGHLTLIQIYLVALSESTLSVFFDLAERSSLRNVVPREQLSAASAQNQAISYTSALIGPGLLPLFALAPNLVILTIVFSLYLIWGRIMSVMNFNYRTVVTPDAIQGRVLGINSLIVRGSLPIGIALTGLLLQQFGGVRTVLIFAGYRLLVALIVTINPYVRRAPRLSELQANP